MIQLNTYFTDEDISKYLRTDKTFTVKNVEIHLKDALRNYIYPALSEAFTDTLMTTPVVAIDDLLKSAVINFAAESFYDMLPVNASNTGAWEHNTEEQKPIRLEVLDTARESRIKAGHRNLDDLLKYLEGHLGDFANWVATQEYQVFNSFRIKTTSEFNGFCNIRNSRGVMLCLQSSMLQTEMLYISSIAQKLDALNLSDALLLQSENLLKTAFANYAYSLGVWDLANTYGYDTIVSINNTSSNRQKGFANAVMAMLERIEKQKASIAQSAINLLEKIIEDNTIVEIEDVTPYQNSKLSTVFNF
ncbi:hypothetical protein LV89_01988 [Arcicella aurantiaca]|uniref:Uncharacterized protein n=1 Tax=Arcicella aurantiaca TaxID=591202 RepID=A0A316E8T7_9BACT|nr:DUF6712 family protein [Arcicella aurantiaca]PWK27173.1 hypothetical protein LV89_01988 [Arcicella aurantiaca]